MTRASLQSGRNYFDAELLQTVDEGLATPEVNINQVWRKIASASPSKKGNASNYKLPKSMIINDAVPSAGRTVRCLFTRMSRRRPRDPERSGSVP